MRATASVLPGAPRRPADCFCRHQLGGYRSWDLFGGLAQPRNPHAGSSDGDAGIEVLSKVVTWFVLVWFGRQRGMKNWVNDGADCF